MEGNFCRKVERKKLVLEFDTEYHDKKKRRILTDLFQSSATNKIYKVFKYHSLIDGKVRECQNYDEPPTSLWYLLVTKSAADVSSLKQWWRPWR